MPIIHRYLLRQFWRVFFICFLSLMGLYIVGDVFQNLEQFGRSSDKHGSVVPVLLRHYAFSSLSFFDTTSAIVTVIAAMFTLASFQRFNELTALLAAGIPKWKVIKPLVVAAAIVALAAAFNREFVMPACRDQLSRDTHDLW